MKQLRQYPFECSRCASHPISDFEIYSPNPEVNDWMIVFPEEQLLHIHYGQSVQEEALNTQEAEFVQHVLLSWVKKYPGKKFFIVVDGSRGDDSEMISEPARKIYMDILRHPQLGQGVFYGFTPGMNFYINMLLFVTRKKIRMLGTLKEAEAEYQRWFAKQGL